MRDLEASRCSDSNYLDFLLAKQIFEELRAELFNIAAFIHKSEIYNRVFNQVSYKQYFQQLNNLSSSVDQRPANDGSCEPHITSSIPLSQVNTQWNNIYRQNNADQEFSNSHTNQSCTQPN